MTAPERFADSQIPLAPRAPSIHDPGCEKTHTSAKCGKYNSPTRYRAICAQHDLALMMRNFSNMFLRARRALEFSHGLGQERPTGPCCWSAYDRNSLKADM